MFSIQVLFHKANGEGGSPYIQTNMVSDLKTSLENFTLITSSAKIMGQYTENSERDKLLQLPRLLDTTTSTFSGIPKNFFWWGGSTNSVEDRGQREWGIWGR
jgi:hypothetical protein